MSGGYFVYGACFTCGRLFTFNPHLVPSIPIDPTNGKPSDMGGDPARVQREPICEQCVEVANLIRAREGRPAIVVHRDAYEPVEGLPE